MKQYYASPGKIIGYLAVACIITLPVAVGFMMSQRAVGMVAGILLILVVSYPVIIKVRHPILALKDGEIVKRNLAGMTTRTPESSIRELIVSVDYLAIRQDGRDDIMIDKGWFSAGRWEALITDLQLLLAGENEVGNGF